MTATLPEDVEYNFLLDQLAPTAYKISLDKCVKLGIVSPYKITCVPVELTEEELLEIWGAVARAGGRLAKGARRLPGRIPGARLVGSRSAQVRHRAKKIKKAKKAKKWENMTPLEKAASTYMKWVIAPQVAGDVGSAAAGALGRANPLEMGRSRRGSSQNVYGR